MRYVIAKDKARICQVNCNARQKKQKHRKHNKTPSPPQSSSFQQSKADFIMDILLYSLKGTISPANNTHLHVDMLDERFLGLLAPGDYQQLPVNYQVLTTIYTHPTVSLLKLS